MNTFIHTIEDREDSALGIIVGGLLALFFIAFFTFLVLGLPALGSNDGPSSDVSTTNTADASFSFSESALPFRAGIFDTQAE